MNNPTVIEQMRQWVAEVVWNGECADWVEVLPQQAIVDAIERHYDGGVAAFVRDCKPADVVPVMVEQPECDNCGAPIMRGGLCPTCAACAESVEVLTLVGELIEPGDLCE